MEFNESDYDWMSKPQNVDKKALAEFKRLPSYCVTKHCYKFPEVVCCSKCKLWKDCTKKGGKNA